MTQDLGSLVAMALAAVAGVVWFVRLEGRVNGHQDQIGDIKADVRYIRDRIDRALNGD